jgi:hypothetical protein
MPGVVQMRATRWQLEGHQMRPIHSRGQLRAGLLCAALAVCLVLPAAASAATPGGGTVQVSVGRTVPVLAKVVALVDVSFTCDSFLIFDWETGTTVESTVGRLVFGSVTLTQASGKSVNVAGADLPESGPQATVVCDGATVQTRTVAIRANEEPWKSGSAVVSARVQIVDSQSQSREIGESGPVVVKLGK